jgi:DNA-binding SARP family transcriptional activator/WD40 repeat protein
MGIGVLGPLVVEGHDNGLAPRDKVVLEALALQPGGVVTADRIAEALWSDRPPATWSKVIQGSVVRLRKLLGPETIQTVGRGYRLVLRPGDVDAVEFTRLVDRAREQLSLGEPERASYTVGEALALWRGPPLAELENWEPGRSEADRLQELRRDAEEIRIEAALAVGRHREILTEARKRVEEAPLRERRWELLARAQYQSGQQADALRTLHQVKRVLGNELGLDPGPDLVALEQAILRQDESLLASSVLGTTSPTCPYLGLVPYDVGDSDGYFGRDGDIEACLRKLAETGVLAVVGPSGSGKSSLVRAGLAAELRRGGQRVALVTPGARPMDALTAVPGSGPPVPLVVDQCEEAVSLCEDVAEQARFFAALTAHSERAPLVVALRADRFGDLATHGEFARLVERGLYLLTPMNAENLHAAIEGPARQAGLRLEQGLVELLVAEVEGRPGALPYLSHALRQTWGRREGSVLTLDGYRATGGIRDAVAQSAEHLYEEMPAKQRTMLRDLMLRLVSPGPEGDPVRSRIPRRLLGVDAEHDQLLEQLVSARLVTSDDGVVELAHEALARAWPRLRGWLDEDAEGQRILRHLSLAADTWDAMGRPESELYRGARLAKALEWRASADPDLTPIERAFLDEGLQLAQEEEQTATQQARQQARINRRLRGLLAGAAFLLIAAVVAGMLAVRQANLTAEAADVAAEAATAADARRVAAQSQLADRIDRSLQLAVAALAVEPSAESRAGLLAALARTPQLTAFAPAADAAFWRMDVSPDGEQVAVMDAANHIWFYDPDSLEPLGDYDPFPPKWDVDGVGLAADPIAFSPDGQVLAIAIMNISGDPVRLVDTSTRRPLGTQLGGQPSPSYPTDLDVSPDGRYLAASLDSEGQVKAFVWDLERPGRPLHEIELSNGLQYVEFSPDSKQLYTVPGWTSDPPPVVKVFDVATGRQVRNLGELGQPLEISPDGSTMAYANGTDVVLADSRTGEPLRRLKGPEETIRQIRFSADARRVVAVAEDSTATVWETTNGNLLERIPLTVGTKGRPGDARLGRNGETAFVIVEDGLMALDLRGDQRYVRRVAPPDEAGIPISDSQRYPSPDGSRIAVARYYPETNSQLERDELTFLTAVDGEVAETIGEAWLDEGGSVRAWSPDGARFALVEAGSRQLAVRDSGSGELLVRGGFEGAHIVVYHPSGDRLLVQEDVGVRLVDAATLEPLTPPVSAPGRRTELLAPVPGGDRAVLVTAPALGGVNNRWGAARQWSLVDVRTGELIREGRLQHNLSSAVVSPDGERLAVGSSDGLEIVELETGRSLHSVDLGASHETEGRHLAWSGDGERVATNDSSGRVSLWDGRTSQLLGTVRPGDVDSATTFLDDDRTLLIVGWDGAVYEWDTSLAHAVDTACGIVGRGLTEAEWRASFGGRPYQRIC